MKRMIWFLLIILSFAYLYGQDIEKVKALSKEVKLLNLLNGIEFTKEQKESIKENINKVREIEKNYEQEINEYAELFQAGLEKSVEILSRGKELPPSLRKDIATYNHKLKELNKEKEERIFQVANEVKESLEPHQIYQLQNFIPCLIPPPGKIRVGQAENPEMLEKQLEKIRNISNTVYVRKKDDIIARAIEKEKEHLPVFAEFDEEAEKERIENLLDKVRTMSDVDFALNKKMIIEEFKGKVEKHNTENEVLIKIRKFLLDPIVLKYI